MRRIEPDQAQQLGRRDRARSPCMRIAVTRRAARRRCRSTRWRGLSEAYGSWKTICICAAAGAARRGRGRAGHRRRNAIAPARRLDQPQQQRGRWSTCRSRIRPPAPASRPRARSNDTPSTARTGRWPSPHGPPVTGKCLRQLVRTCSSGAVTTAPSSGRGAPRARRSGHQRRHRRAAHIAARCGSAGGSGSLAAGSPERRHRAVDRAQRGARASSSGGTAAQQPRGIGMARRARTAARPARLHDLRRRTSPPRGRTISATTPRSWVISRIAMPSSRCSRRSRSRICAWIVTSSAVVGSSAISSWGSQASAMAIITRCRMPPESWCG